MNLKKRIDGLRQRMGEAGADAVLVSQPHNRRYLTGFTAKDSPGGGTAGWLLVTESEALLLVGFLSLEQARHECPDFEVADAGAKPASVVGTLAAERAIKRLACEGSHLTYVGYRDVEAQLPPGCEQISVDSWIEEIRAVKDDEEIAAIRRAASVTDRALAHVLAVIRPGMTERQVAWEAERFMREAGAEAMAFDVGLGSGPNSSLPHAHPTEREIRAGEPIWIDMGAQVDGYCADLTRSFCIGEPEPRLREIWDLVYRAQQAAIAGCRPGMTGMEADALARNVIAEAGYEPAFGHSLGHGVGLVVHERPRLGKTSSDVLVAGHVATFEPGVYLEGWGGVRIEDLGVVREGGVELLSGAAKRLTIG